MELLNLTLGQFLTIGLSLAGFITVLYFYNRTRRRVTVATLRFWPRRAATVPVRRRRRLQQPWSWLLQLLALALLLLAIADWRLDFGEPKRPHVLLLDTSAASGFLAGPGGRTLLDLEREQARRWLDAIPADDPVAVIYAESAPRVAAGFTSDRDAIDDALDDARPGWTALDLEAATGFARSVLELELNAEGQARPLEELGGAGETVYVGPGRLMRPGAPPPLRRFRAILVGQGLEDVGVRRFAARRTAADPARWAVTLEAHHDGDAERRLEASFLFEGRPLGERTLVVPPGATAALDFHIRTETGGRVEVRLDGSDRFPANQRARLYLPPARSLALAVATDRPERLQPFLTALPGVAAVSAEGASAEIAVADRRAAPAGAEAVLYVEPPDGAAPVEAVRRVGPTRVSSWSTEHPVGEGLRQTDFQLATATVLAPGADDAVIASTPEGPVVVAGRRDGSPFVAVGFDLFSSALANRLATPLLFANAIRWFAPESFQIAERRAQTPGVVDVDVGSVARNAVDVVTLSGPPVVWSWSEGRVRLFAAEPGSVRVRTPFEETELALDLPEVGLLDWTPPEGTLLGVPPRLSPLALSGRELWPWLVLLAALLLALDWSLYGRSPAIIPAPATPRSPAPEPTAPEPAPAMEEAVR